MNKPLLVTQAYVPPIEIYTAYVSKAFALGWLTNRGTLVNTLEEKLKEYLGLKAYLTLTTNGTLPLQIAIKALDLQGEIITTPFSYVATTSSIVWENCKPVFVDIDPDYWTIDATKIEEKITSRTTAILATHIYGNPCDVEQIQSIATKHNLKVIYDAAHCFGVSYKGKSIFEYGDVSTCSFHATKLFHTGEGGCMVTKDKALFEKLFWHHNFGHDSPTSFHGVGINAKMSELQAAMGLAVLDNIKNILSSRQNTVEIYHKELDGLPIRMINIRENTDWNYHYFPIVFNTEEDTLRAINEMNKEDIYPRRYFYPSLNTLAYVDYEPCPISEKLSSCILCLPLYHQMEIQSINRVLKTIQSLF